MATKKDGIFQIQIDEDKKIQLLEADECFKQNCIQHVDRKDIATTIRGMKLLNKNGIREFVLNSLLSDTIISKSHGHGLPPTARKV